MPSLFPPANDLPITKDRFHDASTSVSGELGTPTPTAHPTARVSFAESYFDKADRMTATANLGTNGGTQLAAPPDAGVPTRSDTKLVTSYVYDEAGRVSAIEHPRTISATSTTPITDTTTYDLLGRTVSTIANYDDGTPSTDNDQKTTYTYDGDDHVLLLSAVLPGSTHQTTQYNYGATTDSGSDLNSNDVLTSVYYPKKTGSSVGDPDSSQPETYTVNALGERTKMTDRNGSVHSYSYDVLGRMIADDVTGHIGSGVDPSVTKLGYTYNAKGQPELFTSYSSSGGVVNQVKRLYNGFGQIIREYQSNNGSVITSTPKAQYVYSVPGTTNHSRLASMTYTDGRIIGYQYPGGLNDALSRVGSITDGASSSALVLEGYSYLGLGTIVGMAHPETGIDQSDAISGGPSDGGDSLTGLDRFGRVLEQKYASSATSAVVDDFTYSYDRDSNVCFPKTTR